MDRVIGVTTKTGKYDIIIEKDAIERLKDIRADKFVFVTDNNVAKLWLSSIRDRCSAMGISSQFILVNAGEEHKNIDTVLYMYSEFNRIGVTKSDVIVAFGGGVVGDMTAFAGATYLRGVRVVQMPTTLLAMVDSSVGGKSGFDTKYGKNLIGVITQPEAVLIDTSYLSTLPKRETDSGMAEVIKCGFIKDGSILEDIISDGYNVEDVIEKTLGVKASVVEEDEFESGKRMILNFGHTVAHAIEALSGYTKYLHGEAVAVGMKYAVKMSENILSLDKKCFDVLERALIKFSLDISVDFTSEDMLEYIARDKKRRGDGINFVLIEDIGKPVVKKMSFDDVKIALKNVEEFC